MTTQNDQNSPFQDKKQIATENSNTFSIHTMKDDLESLQKGGTLKTEKIIPSSAKKTAPQQSINPFVEQVPAPVTSTIISEPTIREELPTKKEEIEKIIPESQNASKLTTPNTYKIVVVFIVILIISILGLGLYYFLMTRAPKRVTPAEIIIPEEQPVEILQPIIEPEPVVIAPIEKYSKNKANYFIVDLNTKNAEEIKLGIVSLITELKTFSAMTPYEFIIVDANNNPVTFQIFAAASKINLSQAVLGALGKNFSLFIYNDGFTSRIGFSIETLNENLLLSELKKQERTFVNDASFMFLDAVPEIKTGSFITTQYKNTNIHYLNLNKQKDLSIDYAILNSKLVISTSQKIQETLIDFLSSQEKDSVLQKTESDIENANVEIKNNNIVQ